MDLKDKDNENTKKKLVLETAKFTLINKELEKLIEQDKEQYNDERANFEAQKAVVVRLEKEIAEYQL